MAIEEALKKIEEGTYGICEECGKKIEPGRVRVMPLTKLCLTCQSRVEVEMSLEKWAEEQLRYEQLATEPRKRKPIDTVPELRMDADPKYGPGKD